MGGDGLDAYVMDAGFGSDHIVDTGSNIVQFNFGSAGMDLALGPNSLILSFANGDVLHIDGYDPNDPLNTCSISTFQFTDRAFTLQDILDLGGSALYGTIAGPDITGTANADVIQGTDMSESIHALEGNDTITAGAGSDVVEGARAMTSSTAARVQT